MFSYQKSKFQAFTTSNPTSCDLLFMLICLNASWKTPCSSHFPISLIQCFFSKDNLKELIESGFLEKVKADLLKVSCFVQYEISQSLKLEFADNSLTHLKRIIRYASTICFSTLPAKEKLKYINLMLIYAVDKVEQNFKIKTAKIGYDLQIFSFFNAFSPTEKQETVCYLIKALLIQSYATKQAGEPQIAVTYYNKAESFCRDHFSQPEQAMDLFLRELRKKEDEMLRAKSFQEYKQKQQEERMARQYENYKLPREQDDAKEISKSSVSMKGIVLPAIVLSGLFIVGYRYAKDNSPSAISNVFSSFLKR